MKKRISSSLLAIAFLSLLFVTGCQESTPESNKEQMRHIVIFKYTPSATEAEIAEVTKEFRALEDKIPGIVDFEYGVNDSPEGKNQGFTHVYMVTFESPEARDAYLPHPEHKKFGEFLGETGILEDAFVVDFMPEGE